MVDAPKTGLALHNHTIPTPFAFPGGSADGALRVELGVELGVPLAPKRAATVELENDASTVVGHADASGTVTFDTQLNPDATSPSRTE